LSRDLAAAVISFGPVKRNTKKRTTRTARQAFITHHTPASKRIRLKNHHVSQPESAAQDVKNKIFLMCRRGIDVDAMFRLVNDM